MAYLAIARKFRPLRFEDIIGQGHVTRTLQNAIGLNRTHHAFLFTGARGVGKTTAARILARCLNCEKGPTPTPCNECTSCREVISGIASDVVEIDAASNNGVDNIRDLRDNIRYLPASGRRKIYIIDEVHMLSPAAFNALLKTLEEPPAHVTFIMATTDPQKVPDTILSRCQRFDFKRIPVKQIAETLGSIAAKEGVGLSENSLLMLAREADGSMRDAQSLLDQVISAAGSSLTDQEVVEVLGIIDRRQLFECVLGVLEQQPSRSLVVVDQVYTFGFDMKIFARDLLELIRNLNVVRAAKEPERFVDASAEELQLLRDMARASTPDVLSRLFSLMVEGYDALARSESPRMVLELTLLRMSQVRPVVPVDELLSRLTQLEGVLRGGGSGGGAGGGGGSFAGAGGNRGPAAGGGFRPPGTIRSASVEGVEDALAVGSGVSRPVEARGGPPVPLPVPDPAQGAASRVGGTSAAGAGDALGRTPLEREFRVGREGGAAPSAGPSPAVGPSPSGGPSPAVGPSPSGGPSPAAGPSPALGLTADAHSGGGARTSSLSPPVLGGLGASARPTPSASMSGPGASSGPSSGPGRMGFAERIQGIAKAASESKPVFAGSGAEAKGGERQGGGFGARPSFPGAGLGGAQAGVEPSSSASEALRAKGLLPLPSGGDGEDVEMPTLVQPLARAKAPVRPGIVATLTLAELPGAEVEARVKQEGRWIGFVKVWQARPGLKLKSNYLKHGEPLHEEGERIILGFRNQLTLAKAEQEAQEPELGALLREHFTFPIRIECRLLGEGDQAGPGFVEWEQSRERLRRAGVVRQLVEDARVSVSCTLFGVSRQELRFEFERARS